ncbi:curli assembly protein CsgF [Myroides marinus]|uniref:Curli production assembly/transport component CsgF n=1 Tax=Myroides marinus TaxID=703342 RepID=A0A164AGQ9_9FLAO|nr:curli assembly protein CsgF [Myroides marinus]MDR0195815.1 curli assembly protein CsgF [Myroides sp.]KUF42552.1 curli assembly protein CsgF [Myroides marinus]KZE83826.1 curli assembly protein CsgF [Myroides marinus]MDM1347244.1 curli assembly protein CsgF [Myroides marinus]MDM1350286.1 curli assembly protein CsgF [Myroides marinus]
MKNIFYIIILLVSTICSAQQLTYKPMNPFFGGEVFNYQMMLASASAQNSFKDPSASKSNSGSSLDQFSERLNSQLLSQISRKIFNDQFGGDLKEGTFSLGSLSVEIYESSEGMVINILNTQTGEQTQIIMPTY